MVVNPSIGVYDHERKDSATTQVGRFDTASQNAAVLTVLFLKINFILRMLPEFNLSGLSVAPTLLILYNPK